MDTIFIEKAGVVLYRLNVEGGQAEVKAGRMAEIKAKLPVDLESGVYSVRICVRNGVSVAFSQFRYIKTAKAWLNGWRYRRMITITERSGNTLTNYQVRIVLTPNIFDYNKVRNDGGDIRFTDTDGVTLLPYWIEKWNPRGTSIIWVKVPEIPANGEKKIYMYYGNPEATSQSKGEEVFEFFDDFQEFNESAWNWISRGLGSDAHVRVVESSEFHDGYGLEIYCWYSSYGLFTHIYSKYTWNVPQTSYSYLVETRISNRIQLNEEGGYANLYLYTADERVDRSPCDASGAQIHAYYNPIWNVATWLWYFEPSGWDYKWWRSGAVWDNGQYIPHEPSSWYILGIVYYEGKTRYYVWLDGTYSEPYAYKEHGWAYQDFRILIGNTAYTASGLKNTWVDWVRIRKYVSPEPLVSLGNEEAI